MRSNYKSILATLVALFTLLPLAHAQEGVKFESGNWQEMLTKAKEQNKLIFIDVYTEWCGPCKMMVKNIFPLKSVGDMFNSNFINYKIDAEKGEGIEIAAKYGVRSFPTYLFINGDGVLFYSFSGSMPAEKFMEEASKSLTEFNDPEPFPLLMSQYESRKGDKEYLKKLLQKQFMRRLDIAQTADQYFSAITPEEFLNKEILITLLSAKALNTDGPLVDYIVNNREVIAKVLEFPAVNRVNGAIEQFCYGDIARAIENKNSSLLPKIVSILTKIEEDPMKRSLVEGEVYSRYYSAIKDEAALTEVIKKYSEIIFSIDMSIIRERDSLSLAEFDKNVEMGGYDGVPKEQLASFRELSKELSIWYAYRVRDIVSMINEGVSDKTLINKASEWIEIAQNHSSNFTIDEVKAALLFKQERYKEALESQERAISKFNALGLKNEPIQTRLNDKLTLYKRKVQ